MPDPDVIALDFLGIDNGKQQSELETQSKRHKEGDTGTSLLTTSEDAAATTSLARLPFEHLISNDQDIVCHPSGKDASMEFSPWPNLRSQFVKDSSDERRPKPGDNDREPSQAFMELASRPAGTAIHSESAGRKHCLDDREKNKTVNLGSVKRTGQPAYLDLSLLPPRDHSMRFFHQFRTGESSCRSPLPGHLPIRGGSDLSADTAANAAFRSATPGRNSSTAQLTIFYSGSVNVYNVPADTAKAIMLLAASATNPAANFHGRHSASQSFAPTTPMSSTPRPTRVPLIQSTQTLQTGLPIHRKHSLQRFLEKRHDRLSSRAPYRAPVAPD